uniref:Phosphotransferase n=1 Tax=Heteronotia binoei irido-like virus TaxID=3141948 RepID=A0AAU7SRX3_9VIRU
MTLTIHEKFAGEQGYYGSVYWCNYPNNPTRYLCKKLKHNIDMSLEIEHEASRRLAHLPTVYKTKGIEIVDATRWLVSEYVPGQSLYDYQGSEITNIFLHLMCTLEEMREKQICHNDLHSRNIIITPSTLSVVHYHYNGIVRDIRVFGVLPVIIDFGLSRIEDYWCKPIIAGFSHGNLATIIFDPRFDKLRLMDVFSSILPKKLAIMAKVTGAPLLAKIAKWACRNIYKLWAPLNYETEFIFKKLETSIDYGTTGALLSFPEPDPTPTRPEQRRHLRILNTAMFAAPDTRVMAATVLRQGSAHPLFFPFCTVAMFLRRGIKDFLSDRPPILDTVPLGSQWISYILRHYPQNRALNHAEGGPPEPPAEDESKSQPEEIR